MKAGEINSEGLRIGIGFPSAVMLVIGGIVGVGIFRNPAVVAHDLSSPALMLAAWVAGGVIALLGAFVYAELAARLPSTGGEYIYLRETYGPLAAFLFGWTTLLVVHAGGMAAVAIIFAENVNVLAGGALPEKLLVAATLGGLAAVNCAGVRTGNGVQATLGALKVLAIFALITAGLFFAPDAMTTSPPLPSNDTLKAFGAAMIPVVFSYGGWQTANYVAGEIRNPARNLSRALLFGVGLVIALYLLVNVAYLRALGPSHLGLTLTPASDVLDVVGGSIGARLAAAAIALSAFAFLSQAMLTGPRVFFAMARDGYFFRRLAEVGETSRAPAASIVLLAIWAGALAVSGKYEQILSYVIAMNFLFFAFSASCLFVLRRRDGDTRHVHASALHPWSTGLFIAACLAIVGFSFWAYPLNSLVGYAIMALGIPPYLYWRSRSALTERE
ncbi:MAG: amino acid permease [Rhizomicrobium sp.]|jgi:APA family basic amino acid/polyamine antiporter